LSPRTAPRETSSALRFAASVAAAYAAAGVAWILGSDAVMHSISSDPDWLGAAERYKGVGYVAVTALGLGWLIHAGTGRLIRADRLAQANELRVQDLFLNHPQPMWLVDRANLAFLDVNRASVARYGYGREEFLGMKLEDIRPPEDIARLRQLIGSYKTEGTLMGITRHRLKSGELIHARISANPVDFHGRPAMMIMAMDVTQEVAAQEALAHQQAQFRQLHESLGEVLWIASGDGQKMLYVSAASQQVYGVSPAEFEGQPGRWIELVHPEDRALALAADRQLLAQGHVTSEYRIRRPDGTERWIADRKTAIRGEDGQIRLIGGIAEDITEAKAAETRLRQQAEELAQRNAELERFNSVTVGRELDMIALKREVNELAERLGLAPRYPLAFASPVPRQTAAAPGNG
jgi:PAS domain S-box-containing protein